MRERGERTKLVFGGHIQIEANFKAICGKFFFLNLHTKSLSKKIMNEIKINARPRKKSTS